MDKMTKGIKKQEAENALREAAEKWPAEFLSREDLRVFSGNAISIGHLANMDRRWIIQTKNQR